MHTKLTKEFEKNILSRNVECSGANTKKIYKNWPLFTIVWMFLKNLMTQQKGRVQISGNIFKMFGKHIAKVECLVSIPQVCFFYKICRKPKRLMKVLECFPLRALPTIRPTTEVTD